jgi:signal transduction histidine kinase
VAQEAFTNVLKHSHVLIVRLSFILLSSSLHLIIQDDGIGFEMKEALSGVARGTTMGLLSMKERVALVGGT